MIKVFVLLWIVLAGAVAGAAIGLMSLSGSVDELEGALEEQNARLAKLSESVGRMSQVVRQVVTINSLRADEDDADFEAVERPRARPRGGSLEDQVDELSDLILPYKDLMDQQLKRRELRAAARARHDADRERYSEEELTEMRELFRGGRGRGDREEQRENLEQLVEKYPDSSYAGCATLRLARGMSGEEAESYYLKAIQSYSDSFCHGGTQVGALARDRLADYYEEIGQAAKAQSLRRELKNEFPGAVDHRGDPL